MDFQLTLIMELLSEQFLRNFMINLECAKKLKSIILKNTFKKQISLEILFRPIKNSILNLNVVKFGKNPLQYSNNY